MRLIVICFTDDINPEGETTMNNNQPPVELTDDQLDGIAGSGEADYTPIVSPSSPCVHGFSATCDKVGILSEDGQVSYVKCYFLTEENGGFVCRYIA